MNLLAANGYNLVGLYGNIGCFLYWQFYAAPETNYIVSTDEIYVAAINKMTRVHRVSAGYCSKTLRVDFVLLKSSCFTKMKATNLSEY